ncbi:unnamed protein product [Lymnaea stagnalis]|uniref:C2H2-type domain-containing protein n=1 Tax=Lymnaea stagnalis TaxID=6523 RepID=A0AAV2HTU2_LYMST
MSDQSLDLEGGEEDLIGDADLSEWNVLLEGDNTETSLYAVKSQPSTITAIKNQSQDEKREKSLVETKLQESITLEKKPQINDKSELQNLTHQIVSQKESEPKGIGMSDSNVIKSSHSVDIGQSVSTQSTLAQDNIETGNSAHPSSKLSPTKNKLPELENIDPKVQKLDNVSDILIAIGGDERVDHSPKEVEDKDNEVLARDSAGAHIPFLSEEESRNIDNWLVEDMMEGIKQELIPQKEDKFIVRFSPVELADLANSSVQDLIQSNPNLAFYFKRQGKFKKKKGFAESYHSKSDDVKLFIQKLLFIQLVENKIEVSVTYIHRMKEPVVVSFNVCLNKTNNLFKLVKNPEDSKKGKPEIKAHFEIQKVPATAVTFALETIFPYSKSISVPFSKGSGTDQYKGPITVNYANDHWIEAMLECCSDFRYESFPMTVLRAAKELAVKSKACVKTDVEAKKEEQLCEKSKRFGLDASKAVKESSASVGNSISDSPQESSKDRAIDADISSMTLDVCTGMLESLNKLKQLGTDNPNILKILEMQAQLASLQESLSHTSKTKASGSDEQASDPWTISPSDTFNQTAEQGNEKKQLTKKERKKLEDDLKAKKRKKEMEDLQRRLEEADEAERQREEDIKHQREMEIQQSRAADEKAKSNWARKLIEDAKSAGSPITGDSAATKLEAQRMLKAREERLKGEEDSKLKEDLRTQNEAAIKTEPERKLEVKTEYEMVPSEDGDFVGAGGVSVSYILVDCKIFFSHSKLCSVIYYRKSFDGPLVYSEQEYEQLISSNTALPADYSIQLNYFTNRRCPVSECPATTFFKTESSFIDHWEIFHKPNVTMRFCNSCSAYFMNISELESHLIKRHSFNDRKTVSQLVTSARTKCVTNPSYRCPGKYLGP